MTFVGVIELPCKCPGMTYAQVTKAASVVLPPLFTLTLNPNPILA